MLSTASRSLLRTSLRSCNTRPLSIPISSVTRSRNFSRTAAVMKTISETIKEDHSDINTAYEHIVNAANDDERTRWQNQFVWELARHSIAEEIVVYPAFEKHLGARGKQMADGDRAEHQVLKNKLEKFQKLKPQHPEFMPTLDSIIHSLREHIVGEERDDLPALESAISSDDSVGMAKSFGVHKAIAPSRSHPLAPNKPPFETLGGVPVAVFDHITDLFRKFPHGKVSPNPSTH